MVFMASHGHSRLQWISPGLFSVVSFIKFAFGVLQFCCGVFVFVFIEILFVYLFIHSFIYLFWAALGLCCCAWAFSVVLGLLIAVASLVAEHRL